MIAMPHVMAHCCIPMSRPRFDGGEISEIYTGTWAEQMPTERPLTVRPTMSIGTSTDAATIIQPMILCHSRYQ